MRRARQIIVFGLLGALTGGLAGGLSGCDSPPVLTPDATTPNAAGSAASAAPEPVADPSLNDAVMQKWSRSCVLCHVDGNGGAPRLGDSSAWQPRLAQGKDTLLQHTLEGFNNMPPLGYCMACERDDFVALIDFMSGAH